VNQYRLQLRQSAYRELERLKRGVVSYELVRDAIHALADDPRPRQSKQLRDRAGQRSRRTGDYRIIYTIDDDARIVTIVRIRHRKDVYR
jgi:mRNA interferase RelE/StbE